MIRNTMQLRALLTVRSSPLVAFHASHLLLNNVLIIFFYYIHLFNNCANTNQSLHPGDISMHRKTTQASRTCVITNNS